MAFVTADVTYSPPRPEPIRSIDESLREIDPGNMAATTRHLVGGSSDGATKLIAIALIIFSKQSFNNFKNLLGKPKIHCKISLNFAI